MFVYDYKEEIIDYCVKNGLSADKLFKSPKTYTDTWAGVIYHKPSPANNGVMVMGGPPADIMLEIYLENGTLRFKQTEHTYRLSADKQASVAAMA